MEQMKAASKETGNAPVKPVIYQVFPRLFGNNHRACKPGGTIEENGCGKFADFTMRALEEIKALGATHVWYTGVLEHATQTDYSRYGIPKDHPAVVKGKAGSPYAVKDYYDVDPDLAHNVDGRMEEFEHLVQRTHRAGLKVVIDFVPNHVSRQYAPDRQPAGVPALGSGDDKGKAFSPDNNFYYIPGTALHGQFDMKAGARMPYSEFPAKATGNDRFDASPNRDDWYETVKLNYGVDYVGGSACHFNPIPDTWYKMLDILKFWADKEIDGFRCDMAEMVPVDFWEWAVPQVKRHKPGIVFIGEVYNPQLYRTYLERGRFDYLYDKVGLYDTLRAVVAGDRSAIDLSRCWQSVEGIGPHMVNFLENHDEQRVASSFFAGNARKAVPALIVSALMGTNPFLLYSGQELGERGMDSEGFSGRDGRTTIFDYWRVDSVSRWRNGGKFDGKLLTDAERSLRGIYQKVLLLCNAEPAITQGSFFDLTYANRGGWRFDEHRQFAFLRKFEKTLLLTVVNFNATGVEVGVNIPQHAFDCLGWPRMDRCKATDLLGGQEVELSLTPDRPATVSIEGYMGRVLKVTLP
ncbi:MAG: alpha-amylase family protein [Prevotellaceae bacterium]|nr:alpha-amylase family protein [Prevotellaceae bacterium]